MAATNDLEFWITCEYCSTKNPFDHVTCKGCFNDLSVKSQTNKMLTMTELDNALKNYDHEKRIDDNFNDAYSQIPESFCKINMLYFKGSINDVPLSIFIDTGAQMTIMSKNIAKLCKLEDLIDKKYTGEAVGVGTQNIIGKIHLAEISIDQYGIVIPCSFSILDTDNIDVIFGLDMLLSHGIILDMKEKNMKINSIIVPFLNDNEIENNK